MGITWRLATLVILLCALDMQALQHDSHTHLGNTSVIDSNWSELSSNMEKMHQAMASVEASGDGDVDFVRLMLPHHQAAIDMAKTQLLYGKDPQMRRLAQEIIIDQQSEITLMQLWLTQHAALSANPGHASDHHE
jgi:uncharacterized protein (DUF305 family)